MVQSLNIQKDSSRSSRVASQGRLTILVLICLVLGGINLLMNFGLVLAFFGVAAQDPPSMVQLSSGAGMGIKAMENSSDRTPEAIIRFVQETMTLLFSASGQVVDVDGNVIQDYGVELDTGMITSVANIASYGVDEDFRAALLLQIAGMTNPKIFSYPDRNQNILIIQNITDPVKISDGKWKVFMIANLVRISNDIPEGKPTPFNKEILVRSVTPSVAHSFDSPLNKEISQIRLPGLEITQISNYIIPK